MRSISEARDRNDYYQPAPEELPAAPKHPRLLALVLLALLAAGCVASKPESHSTAAESAVPTVLTTAK
ncbi:hypothetical protein [Hymenobacter ruber]